MIGRVLLAAILAGIAAGLVMGVIQHVRLTPLIIQAETFEHVAHGHGVEEHSHGDQVWSPADGLERTFFTTLTATLSAVGFSLLLAGVSLLANFKITRSNGWIWGICGFLSVLLAPAIGLPPELPGMPAVDLSTRQVWWIATIALTGLGLWRLAVAKGWIWTVASLALIVLPHFFTPAKPADQTSGVPATLASEFVANSIAANMIMWLVIGVALGYLIERMSRAYET
jgi:cobalt transporter subunit CbtA